MAENYSLNSKFGLNVSSQGAQTKQQTQQIDISKNVGDFFESMTSYVSEFEDVFSGKVEREINMYSRQAMFVGMNLRASEQKRNFDMNI